MYQYQCRRCRRQPLAAPRTTSAPSEFDIQRCRYLSHTCTYVYLQFACVHSCMHKKMYVSIFKICIYVCTYSCKPNAHGCVFVCWSCSHMCSLAHSASFCHFYCGVIQMLRMYPPSVMGKCIVHRKDVGLHTYCTISIGLSGLEQSKLTERGKAKAWKWAKIQTKGRQAGA